MTAFRMSVSVIVLKTAVGVHPFNHIITNIDYIFIFIYVYVCVGGMHINTHVVCMCIV